MQKQKQEIRKRIKFLKKQFTKLELVELSYSILKKVEHNQKFIDANIVLLYWSMSDEVFTHSFVEKWSDSKTILLPSVYGDQMQLKKYTGDNHIIAGERYGIGEPDGELFTDYQAIDFALIPGVAFDENNNRLGRGKAYYDKFLNATSAYKLGVCFPFQIVDHVPMETTDVKMDEIV